RQRGFGWQLRLTLAGRQRADRACARTDQGANSRPFAATGQSANQRATGGAATNFCHVAFRMSLTIARDRVRSHRNAIHVRESHGKYTGRMQPAGVLGLAHHTSHWRAPSRQNLAAWTGNVIRQRAAPGLSFGRLARIKLLAKLHCHLSAGWNATLRRSRTYQQKSHSHTLYQSSGPLSCQHETLPFSILPRIATETPELPLLKMVDGKRQFLYMKAFVSGGNAAIP